jgi:DNA-binding PucR family transcriptional regulator
MAILLTVQNRDHRLTAGVAAEYESEAASQRRSSTERRAELVRHLLAGGSLDTSGLQYRMDDAWHVCVIALGAGGERAVAAIATALDRALLLVAQDNGLVWAWLGGPRRLDAAVVDDVPLGGAGQGVILAISESLPGLEGWRLAHRQAEAALRIALIQKRPITHYAEVASVAPFLADTSMARAFVDLALAPLNRMRDGGTMARETLHAVFNAGGQVLGASKELGVNRHTVRRRIESIERALGCPPFARHVELGLALQLEALLDSWPQSGMHQLARATETGMP